MQDIARMDYATKEIRYEDCLPALRVEAEWMLMALDQSISTLREVGEELLQAESSPNKQNAMDILAAVTWVCVYERLFALEGVEHTWFQTVMERLWDDEPWHVVVAPLATILHCRPKWAWQILRQIAWNYPDDLVVFCSKFKLYEEWHDIPTHSDCLLDVQLYPVFGSRKEVAQMVYRHSAPDEREDVTISG